uniref:RNase H type-1 domain-containing protein n=1 Tax=Cannabis sativa TaxID=3483 RepID=A0A803PEE9_CANSA
MELSHFGIQYQLRISIKGQALANFIVECTGMNNNPEEPILKLEIWKIYVDGASSEKGSGGRIILISPQKHRLQSALQFEFEAFNNKAEHEAMIAGLQLAKEVGAQNIELYSDSQLVFNQIYR